MIKRLVMLEIKISQEIKEKLPTKKLEDIKEGIDILTMNPQKDPTDTDSSLELLINLICKGFKMKPKQAAALLTNSNQYLLHSVVKGLKGNYEPVVKYYKFLYKYSIHMCNLLELESQKNQNNSTMLMILNALKIGFFSYSEQVVQSCIEVFIKISDLTADLNLNSGVYQWFITTTQEGGISAILYALKKHWDLVRGVVATIVSYSRGNMPSILREIIRPLYPASKDYVAILNDFVHILHEKDETRNELVDSGLIDYWLEVNIRSASLDGNIDTGINDGSKSVKSKKISPEEQITSITFVVDIWILFPNKLSAREDL